MVGGRTFGDAAVRRAITLDDGGAIILSVAKYYSPQGKAIQDTGVIPSVRVRRIRARTTEDEAQRRPAAHAAGAGQAGRRQPAQEGG